jgi:EAL and modified HD-GYP domain-containing signal transduction protein
MEEILSRLNLAEDVQRALLFREGTLGTLLSLAERLEKLDFHSAATTIRQIHCTTDTLLEVQLEAINWTNSFADAT